MSDITYAIVIPFINIEYARNALKKIDCGGYIEWQDGKARRSSEKRRVE